MFDFSKKQNQWITIVFLAIIWGSSFILMKKGLVSFTPTEITYYRIFLVFAILFPFSLKGTKSISLKKWGGTYFIWHHWKCTSLFFIY
jgi:drug/metabolite transporter (DMT)-like permease